MRTGTRLLGLAGLAIALSAQSALAAPCSSTFGAAFAGSYTCNSLGTPGSVPANLGGITFLDSDTLLIGGAANGGAGAIYQIDVTRDAGNHVTGFAGSASLFATAPFIDGGLAFGPGGVLFATGYPNNTLLQIKPGSSAPDKTTSLTAPGVASSVGTLAFVPTGFAGAGQLKIASYSSSVWYSASLTSDGTGTFDVTIGASVPISGGPEGIVYVDSANAGFTTDSVLISEYQGGSVGAYEIDASGNPVPGTRRTFLSGLTGAEGAVIDPLTGDFLFSTFGGGNSVYVISGFAAPVVDPPVEPTPAPAPASLALLAASLLGLGGLRRRA